MELSLNCGAFDGITDDAVTVNVTAGAVVVGEMVTVDTWGRGVDETRTNRPMRPHRLGSSFMFFVFSLEKTSKLHLDTAAHEAVTKVVDEIISVYNFSRANDKWMMM